MKEEFVNSDVAKEFITVLSYCDNSFVNNIPNYVLKKLNNLAADSLKEFYIDRNKSLIEQDISSECRELLGMMYFMYMIDSEAKKEVLNILLKNFDGVIG